MTQSFDDLLAEEPSSEPGDGAKSPENQALDDGASTNGPDTKTALATMPALTGATGFASTDSAEVGTGANEQASKKPKSVPERRAALLAEMDRAITACDLSQVQTIRDQLEKLEQRVARLSRRDRLIRVLERDPVTGKNFAKEYAHDPNRREMQELYAERTTPNAVFDHGGKLIRSDGGEFGLVGGIIRALHGGAAEAGLELNDTQLEILTKHMAWDTIERIHGIGAGYCRDAAWICWLWAQAKNEPFNLAAVPTRKPLPTMAAWASSKFPKLLAEALKKLATPDDEPSGGTNNGAANNGGGGESAAAASNAEAG